MIKISLVIATYNSGDDVRRLIASLDAQTIDAGAFEAIFVDDGSTDGTEALLRAEATTRPWMRVEAIENSGWPSRPRNVGTALARGEYVLYMDHDDEIYPGGLERCASYLASHSPDVLHIKESNTQAVSWGMEHFTRNQDNIIGQDDPLPLTPLTPHKLYRLAFLSQHDIAFEEGRRVLYEDNRFNIEVLARAESVAVLADTPIYKWVREVENTGSSTIGGDRAEYWSAIAAVLELANDRLAHRPRLRDAAVLYQHRLRIAGYFRPGPFTDGLRERLDGDLAAIRDIVDRFIPPHLDDLLSNPLRAKMRLFRGGHLAELAEYASWDAELVGRTALIDAVPRDDGTIALTTETRWQTDDGRGPGVRLDRGRLIRSVPEAVAARLSREDLDLTTDFFAAAVVAGIRSPRSSVTWLLPTQPRSFSVKSGAKEDDVYIRATSILDPETAAGGSPLPKGLWEFNTYTSFADRTQQRRVKLGRGQLASAANGDEIGRVKLEITPKYSHIDFRVRKTAKTPVPKITASATPNAGREGFETEVIVERSLVNAGGTYAVALLTNSPATRWIVRNAAKNPVARVLLGTAVGSTPIQPNQRDGRPGAVIPSASSPVGRRAIVLRNGVPITSTIRTVEAAR